MKYLVYGKKFSIDAGGSIEGKINLWVVNSTIGAYRNNLLRNRTTEKIQEIVDSCKLPAICRKISEVNPITFGPDKVRCQMERALIVLPKVVEFLKMGFHPKVVVAMLKESVSEDSKYGNEFGNKFYRLYTDRSLRAEVWGVEDTPALMVAMAILSDVTKGVNVDDTSPENFEKSACFEISRKTYFN